MFKRLYVDNYRCFVNFDLAFQDLTLLLGRNGTGKTSVLDVVYALRELLNGTARIADSDIFPTRTLTAWQNRGLQVFEVEAELPDDTFVYRLEIEQDTKNHRSRISNESLVDADGRPLFEFKGGDVRLYRDDNSLGPTFPADWKESALARIVPRDENTRLTGFLEFMRNVLVCGLYPAGFEPETTGHEVMLARDAHNFSAWYQHLQLERPGQVEQFRRALEDVIDGFSGIRLQKVGRNARAFTVDFNTNGTTYELGLDEISDGQRALVALYSLVYLSAGLDAEPGYTLFLDEPENYLALCEIEPWLAELSARCGDAIPQAVICSHHPELIDYLGLSSGISLSREPSGVIRATRVADMALTTEGGLKLSEIVARGWDG